MSKFYLNVAIDTPLFRVFDYLPLEQTNISNYKPGARVNVPFGRTTKIGIILSTSTKTELKATQLKTISRLIDDKALLSSKDISLYRWAADYYHHPIGEVFAQALPKKLRSDQHIILTKEKQYLSLIHI